MHSNVMCESYQPEYCENYRKLSLTPSVDDCRHQAPPRPAARLTTLIKTPVFICPELLQSQTFMNLFTKQFPPMSITAPVSRITGGRGPGSR